jgi:hypothetical protein
VSADTIRDIPNLAACYAVTYGRLVKVARELGYALAIHGSMGRDLDLIAAPWTSEAVSAEELAEAIREHTGGFLKPSEEDDYHRFGKPGCKPHGRLCFAYQLGGGPYVDLSVMPRYDDSGIRFGFADEMERLRARVAELEAQRDAVVGLCIGECAIDGKPAFEVHQGFGSDTTIFGTREIAVAYVLEVAAATAMESTTAPPRPDP